MRALNGVSALCRKITGMVLRNGLPSLPNDLAGKLKQALCTCPGRNC